MNAKYWIRIALGVLVVFGAGMLALLVGRRATDEVRTIRLWIDSLAHGSGPVAMRIPFVPVYLAGDRVGTLDSVIVLRHVRDSVDGLRIVVKVREEARRQLESCAVEIVSLSHFDPKHALRCTTDTTGLVPFGAFVSRPSGLETTLLVRPDQLAHAPWRVTDTPMHQMHQEPAPEAGRLRSVGDSLRRDVRPAVPPN